MDYEADVSIDESALDVEWIRQPMLMLQYAKYAASTRREADRLKEALEVLKAKLSSQVRKDPSLFGLEKVTESAVESAIIQTADYQQAMQALIEARYENEIAQVAVRALDAKKSALENLVRLLGMSYFAGPETPRDLPEAWREAAASAQRRSENIRVRLRRRKQEDE